MKCFVIIQFRHDQKKLYRVIKEKVTFNIHEHSFYLTVEKTFAVLGFEKNCYRILSALLSQ